MNQEIETAEVWRVTSGPIDISFANKWDDCRDAYRVSHIGLAKSIPVPFARRRDAERALAIVVSRCRCKSTDDADTARDELRRAFGSFDELFKTLCEECCAW